VPLRAAQLSAHLQDALPAAWPAGHEVGMHELPGKKPLPASVYVAIREGARGIPESRPLWSGSSRLDCRLEWGAGCATCIRWEAGGQLLRSCRMAVGRTTHP